MNEQTPSTQPPTPAAPVVPAEPTRATRRARAGRRLVAASAAAALVVGVGGAGYAAGRTAVEPTTASTGSSAGVRMTPDHGWRTPHSNGTGTGTGTGGPSTDTTTTATASQLTGLVRITATLDYENATAAGTGMVLTSTGQVVTNHHVVAGATSIRATVMSTGTTYTATVVGTDSKDDVALLQLRNASGLTPVRADVDGLSVGDAVTNVGDANGTVRHLTASTGKILALGHAITVRDEQTGVPHRLTDLVKVSSDVMPGDSGGATYDAEGEVVAMTTAATSGTPDIDGFAVPIGKVLTVVSDLQDNVAKSAYSYGYPAFLGIGLTSTTTTVAGVFENTPADRAGLAAGDRITRVGSTHVTRAGALRRVLEDYSPGDRVAVRWTDPSGTAHSSTVTLSRGPVR